MIVGFGEDVCDIRRIEALWLQHGERFLLRCFTEAERAIACSRPGPNEPAATLAKRFAAKEACAKALGTGIASGVYMRDIGVTHTPLGAPLLSLTGGAALRLHAVVPSGYEPYLHVTLSDEYPLAKATVIIEARPVASGPAH